MYKYNQLIMHEIDFFKISYHCIYLFHTPYGLTFWVQLYNAGRSQYLHQVVLNEFRKCKNNLSFGITKIIDLIDFNQLTTNFV